MRRESLWTAIPVALFVASVGFQVFGPHPIGKSDNGDFPKVLGRMGVWVAPEFQKDLFSFFVTDYRVDAAHVWNPGIPGTEVGIAWIAKGICWLVLPAGRFDMRVLGALHGALFLCAFWLCLMPLAGWGWKRRLAITAVLLAVFSDPQYSQFFSTAYMDTASMVFLALVFAVGWNAAFGSTDWRWGVAFCAVGALFLGTKLQHQICLVPLVLFCIAMWWRARRPVWLVGPVVLAAVSCFMWWATPAGYRVEPLFSAIYFKLLPMAEKPEDALRELNRPAEDIAYKLMWAYSAGSPLGNTVYRAEFLRDVSTLRVLGYYVRHPGTALQVLRTDFLAFSADVPISSFGTRRRVDLAAPLFRVGGIQVWSWFRRGAALVWPWHVWLVYLGVVVFGLRSRLWPLGLMVGAIGVGAFLAGSLLDATETSRHILLYQEATDFVCLVGVGMLTLLPMREKFV